jgi:hypothetical protein
VSKRSAQSKSQTSARPTASAAAPVAAAAPTLAPATDRWPWALLALCVVFNAVALWPEWTARVAARNDTAFHLLMIEGASAALTSTALASDTLASHALAGAANPLDFWIPQLELGFPQFLYYQHLPHLVLAALHRLGAGTVSAAGLLHGAQYLLLVAMPCTVAWSMSRLGFSPAASAFGGAASTLLSADSRMALEYNSYVWRGFGLFSQLCGVHLFFITAARLSRTMRTGTGYAGTAAWLAALVLSHLLFGAFMALTSVLLWLAGAERRTAVPRLIRLGVVGVGAFALASYLLVPFLESSTSYLSSVRWAPDSATRVRAVLPPAARGLSDALFRGDLLDFGRLPVITGMALAGLLVALRRRDAAGRVVAVGLLVWTALYMLRPGAGVLEGVIPAHRGAATFRFSSMVGVFAILAAGYAAGVVWEWLAGPASPVRRWLPAPVRALTALLLLAALLAPAARERWTYYAGNREILAQATDAFQTNDDARAMLAVLQEQPGGRTFAGPVRGRSCAMSIGRAICLSDLLNAQGTATVGNPMQALALASGLMYELPVTDPAMYDLLDVRHVVAPSGAAPPSFYQPDTTIGRYTLYRVATSGSAQYVAVTARQRTSSQDTLWAATQQWLRDGGAARREVVRWDYHRPAGPLALRAPCAQPVVEREAVTSQQLRVEVACPGPAGDTLAVAFKMTYHPQWQVTVDGAPVSTYMVSPGFLAVDVLPGRHRLEARYVAHPWKLPLLLGGILLFLGICARSDWADRPARWWLHRSAPVSAPG